MTRTTASLSLLVALPFALAACSTPSTTGVVDWARPIQPTTSTPVFLHDLAIANPPYPLPSYPNYFDEPTRFEFHPRPTIYLAPDSGIDETEEAAPDDGSYLENGILYVDPNQ